jgi:hypothetical protein
MSAGIEYLKIIIRLADKTLRYQQQSRSSVLLLVAAASHHSPLTSYQTHCQIAACTSTPATKAQTKIPFASFV